MNQATHSDLIHKLADQAHNEAYETYLQRLQTEKADKVFFNDIFNQRFAELIVKECAALFALTFTDEQYQRRIDKTILKHFELHA
jgi:hypothetical protein